MDLSKPSNSRQTQRDHGRHYIPKEKMVALGIKYINKYGFITPHDNEKTTYERLVAAIRREPDLMNLNTEDPLVQEFINDMRKAEVPYLSKSLIVQKAKIMLHAPNINLRQAYLLLYVISYFLDHKRKEASKSVETDSTMSIKAKLIHVEFNDDGTQTYDFVDKNGIFYRKYGNPPGIYMRKKIGSRKKLADSPYDMFYNDSFEFKAKTVNSYSDHESHIVNIIKNIQPIA